MIERKCRLVITFPTTSDAINMELICDKLNSKGRLIPLPQIISAGCGLAWCAELEKKENLIRIIEKEEITIESMYECLV